MRELVFLLEEESAEAMLKSLEPRVARAGVRWRMIAFEGKQDLERQMARKIRLYANPLARFIVLRDQDIAACGAVKARLLERCRESGREEACLVRIACRELESFYLADLQAVESALGLAGLARQQGKSKFRNPDRLGSPSQELVKLTQRRYQKVSGSREMGKHLDPANERSRSFKNLMGAICRMEQDLLALPEEPAI